MTGSCMVKEEDLRVMASSAELLTWFESSPHNPGNRESERQSFSAYVFITVAVIKFVSIQGRTTKGVIRHFTSIAIKLCKVSVVVHR